MKQRTIRTEEDIKKLSADVLALAGYMPFVITVTQGSKIRSEAQNSRHWVMIEHTLNAIRDTVNLISDETGYTVAEVKKLVAADMQAEHIDILYAIDKEAAHKALKKICGIPSSTRLGTKEFSKFDDTLEQTAAEIVGEINAFTAKALT